MKKIYIILAMLLCLALNSFSQNEPCCNDIISTDPDNPVNTERPGLINNFDWRTQGWDMFNPAEGYHNFSLPDIPHWVVTNPYFTTTDSYLWFSPPIL